MSTDFTFSWEKEPDVQAALEARRLVVLAKSGRLPTWAEDAQYVAGYIDGRGELT